MLLTTNKERGNAALGIAIGYFCSNGYTVSIPLNDTQDYDLVIEKSNIFKTVQVKSTSFKSKYGIYQVSLKSSGGTSGKIYKTVIDTNVDLLFVVTELKEMYLIPVSDIKNRATLNLCDKYAQYIVHYD